MKRYFTAAAAPPLYSRDKPTSFYVDSEYHYMNLPGGGIVIVMLEEHAAPDPSWVELPKLLNQAAAGFNGVNHALGTAAPAAAAGQTAPAPIAGVLATDSTAALAYKLAALHPKFHP